MVKLKESWLYLNEPLPKTETPWARWCFTGPARLLERSSLDKSLTERLGLQSSQFVEAVMKRLGVIATYRSIKGNYSETACILQERAVA
jgi:hypothetical protein